MIAFSSGCGSRLTPSPRGGRCAASVMRCDSGVLELVAAGLVRLCFVAAAVGNGCRCRIAREPDGTAGGSQHDVRARQHYGLVRLDGSLQALRQVLLAPQFDGVVARWDGAEAERSVGPHRANAL